MTSLNPYLEVDFEAASGSIFDRLLGVLVELVVHQAASIGIEVCQGALTGKQTLLWVRSHGALEVRDLGLVEDGCERRPTLLANVVLLEAASEGAGKVHVKGR